MAQAPIWITEAGSLGVVPEGKFYRIALEAEDPDFPGDPSKVTYSLIAGRLPEGVQVNTNGTIEGIPISVADFRGVPSEVSENTTSKFVIRVTDTEDRIADRTFTLTVSGQDKPEWVTDAGSIGEFFDGTEFDFQFEAEDLDPSDTIQFSLLTGEFPNGLTLADNGRLYGFILPISSTVDYNFTLQISDGKDVALREFSMTVNSRSVMTADSIEYTADSTIITTDLIPIYSPYIENNVASIGSFRHDNYFAYKFEGKDPIGDQIKYEVVWGSLPLGLTLDSDTGWLYGYLGIVGLTEETFNFGIQVYKATNPSIKSLIYYTAMSVRGEVETGVTWLTESFLGTIDNGAISTFYVEASHPDATLQYRILSGSDSKLPQGLTLESSGNIVGQVSFKTFSLDGGTTTFDSEHETRLVIDPTTFDLLYTFTVEAYNVANSISITREFTILINREYNTPYDIVYCKAMPPRDDRALLNELLLNQDIISPVNVYRLGDPNFGVAKNVKYIHAYGLSPVALEDYYDAIQLNHYTKSLTLGEVKTARALDDDGNILYEVVYSQIVDGFVNANGESAAAEQYINYPAIDDGSPTHYVYPNSLENMRERLISQIGQVSKVLPRWMLSKQENGEILGFTPAWVIAYTKPGKSRLMRYNILEYFGERLNLVNFDVDRYIIDNRLSGNWDLNTDSWTTGIMTTFDRTQITADSTQQTADDDRYNIDTFVQVDHPPLPMGYIPRDPGPYGNPYETIFDGGSTRFISPVDTFEVSDRNHWYVKFEKNKIVNNDQ